MTIKNEDLVIDAEQIQKIQFPKVGHIGQAFTCKTTTRPKQTAFGSKTLKSAWKLMTIKNEDLVNHIGSAITFKTTNQTETKS